MYRYYWEDRQNENNVLPQCYSVGLAILYCIVSVRMFCSILVWRRRLWSEYMNLHADNGTDHRTLDNTSQCIRENK